MPLAIPPDLRLTGTPSTTGRPSRGRALTAGRAFGPGDLIARFGGGSGNKPGSSRGGGSSGSSPTLALPDSASQAVTCAHCLRTDRVVRACTGCRTAAYCSPACQKADWARGAHKAGECKAFQRVRAERGAGGDDGAPTLPTAVRALIQVLLRDDLRDAMADLDGHVEQFRSRTGTEWRDMSTQAMAALHYLGQPETQSNFLTAMEMLCKLQINSFDRQDEDFGDTGLFLNPALSMANHSCVPNAFVQFNGREAFLRAYRAIEKDEEVEISYIDCNLHRSYRQKALNEQWGFECKCPRCADDLDVYQVSRSYPHLDLNLFSLNPDLQAFRNPSIQTSLAVNVQLQRVVEGIYPKCITSLNSLGPGRHLMSELRDRWQLCKPLRDAKLFAVEPVPRVMGEASIFLGERGLFEYALALSCFLSVNSDAIKSPMPFGPLRVKGLLMVANLLSNTAPISGTNVSASDASLSGRVRSALSKMDQATMTQAILSLVVRWAPLARSEEWLVFREASAQLQDIESLRGREKERDLIRLWAKKSEDPAAAMFFEYAVLKPVQELAGFALDIMDEFVSNPNIVKGN